MTLGMGIRAVRVARAVPVVVALLAVGTRPAAAQTTPLPEPAIELTASQDGPAGLVIRVPAGWELYAPDPGVSGLALEVRWRVDGRPADVTTRWPEPRVRETAEGPSRVYVGRVEAEVELPDSGRRVEASIRWAMCRGDLCVPGTSTVRLKVPNGLRSGGAPWAISPQSHTTSSPTAAGP